VEAEDRIRKVEDRMVEINESERKKELKEMRRISDTSWPEEFLLKDQLLSLCESPCVLFGVFPLLLLIFVLCV